MLLRSLEVSLVLYKSVSLMLEVTTLTHFDNIINKKLK